MTLDPITVVLVGCGEAKLKAAAPAKDLYTSRLFKMSRSYAEICDEWRIVSARHGLLNPETVVEPYDDRLKRADRQQWGFVVASSLIEEFRACGPLDVVILAGATYADPIVANLRDVAALRANVAAVREPLRGLQIGERLHWFAEQHRAGRTGAAS